MCAIFILIGTFTLTLQCDENKENIATDGAGRISVTDISSNASDEKSGLFCEYRSRKWQRHARVGWYLKENEITRKADENMEFNSSSGWYSELTNSRPYLKMVLKRMEDENATEGFFSFRYEVKGRVSESMSVGIFYPSE